jgi:class 3 adenylate cyclase/tetratricopeptide (TPR) repeat protein
MFCHECGERTPDRAKFCPACGTPQQTAGPVDALPVETRRTVTVLFVDVTGSTPLGELLDPEAIRRIFSRYFGEVAAIVARHGGTLEKFAGDALVAVFGLPVLHEDDALRAVRAASESRAALAIVNDELVRDYGLGLNTRTGINTGEVVTGANATGSTLATGDMVNVAARLEGRAAPGEIVIGEATYRLVRDAVTVEQLAPLELKGKSAPVSAYRVVDLAPDTPGVMRRLESPLVGRSFELAELLDAFDAAVEGPACRAVTLLGDAGSGKSRLAHELTAVVGERASVLEGRCVPYGEGITYFPLSIMLKPLAGIEDGDSRDAAREKLLALLPEMEEASLVVTRLAGAIGLDDVLARPEEIAWAVRRLLESLARERPVLVFLDDLHWAEPTFLRLIEHLTEFADASGILLVCSSRPELAETYPALTSSGGTQTIVLDSLPQTACGALISNLLGGDDVAAEITARVAEAAEGNPFFIEETARMLLDEGLIALHGSRWEPLADLEKVVLPPSIEALLAARLDRLEPAELVVLQRAAVIGRIFGWGAVRALTPEAELATLADALEGLLRKEVVFTDAQLLSGEDAYRFGHILVRDAAYRGLPKETRSGLHEQFASFLESATGDRSAEYEEIIGYHLEQSFTFRTQLGPIDDAAAEVRRRAHARLTSAGERALLRGDLPASLNLFKRAAALAAGSADRAETLTHVGRVLDRQGELVEADAMLQQALELAQAEGDELRSGRAEIAREFVLLKLEPEGRSGEIVDLSDRLADVFEANRDELGLAHTWRLRSEVGRLVCRFGEEEAALEQALAHAYASGDEREAAEIKLWLGSCLCYGPTPVGAGIARAQEMLESARGVRWVEASIHGMLGYLLAMADEPAEARDHYRRGDVILEELGMTFSLAVRTVNAGRIDLMAGDLHAAETWLRRGYERLEQIGETEIRSTAAAVLAQVLYDQGRDDESERFALTSEELAAADDVYSQLLWRSALGKVRARRDGDGEGRALAEEAVRLAAATDSLSFHGWALLDLANVESILSGEAPPAALVAEATDLFTRKQDAASLRRMALQFGAAAVAAVRT